jgi:hypothetical protein
MQEQVICPSCENRIRKGSAVCIGCGNKVPENLPTAPPEPTLEESEILDETEQIPSLEDLGFEDIPAETPTVIEPEVLPPVEEDLNWDESIPTTEAAPIEEDLSLQEETVSAIETEAPPESSSYEPPVREGRSTDMSWEVGVDEVKEGMPFKEVERKKLSITYSLKEEEARLQHS